MPILNLNVALPAPKPSPTRPAASPQKGPAALLDTPTFDAALQKAQQPPKKPVPSVLPPEKRPALEKPTRTAAGKKPAKKEACDPAEAPRDQAEPQDDVASPAPTAIASSTDDESPPENAAAPETEEAPDPAAPIIALALPTQIKISTPDPAHASDLHTSKGSLPENAISTSSASDLADAARSPNTKPTPKDAAQSTAQPTGTQANAPQPTLETPAEDAPESPAPDVTRPESMKPRAFRPGRPHAVIKSTLPPDAPSSEAGTDSIVNPLHSPVDSSTLTPPAIGAGTLNKTVEEVYSLPTSAGASPANTPILPFGHISSASIAGADSAQLAHESPAPDLQNTFDQIVLGLRGNFDVRTGKAEIQLQPPNLGDVRVSVSLENGVLTADFQSSSDAVRGLLKDNMEKLKNVLEAQGVAVDRLSVDSPRAVTQAAATPSQGQQSSFGSATHDGKSAGQHTGDPRGNQRQNDPAAPFLPFFRKLAPNAPIDLVA